MKPPSNKSLFAWALFVSISMHAQQPPTPADLGTGPLTADSVNRSNVIDYGISLSTDFDDNATDPSNMNVGRSNFRFSTRPQIDLALTRDHFTGQFSYDPSFNYSGSIDAYNSTSHAAFADLKYSFTRRLSLQLRNSFLLTTNPYDSWQAATQASNLGILNQPNSSAIGANIRNTTEQSEANLVYQLGRHTSVGVGGTFTNLNYQTVADGTSATGFDQKSQGWSGNAFYSQQLTAKYSVGIQYRAQDLSSHGISGSFGSLSHQVLGFLTVSLKPTIQLSIFVGPERSSLDDNFSGSGGLTSVHLNSVSLAAGSTLSWQGKHNGLSGSFVQQVSDSGLNGGGSLLVRTLSLQLQRQIAARLSLNFFGRYISNNQLDILSPLSLGNSASAGLSVSRGLTPHVAVSLSAMRQQFLGTQGNGPSGYLQHSHDVATIALSYTFARPIGR